MKVLWYIFLLLNPSSFVNCQTSLYLEGSAEDPVTYIFGGGPGGTTEVEISSICKYRLAIIIFLHHFWIT